MPIDDPALRADRLGVMTQVFGVINEPPDEAHARAYPLLDNYEAHLFDEIDREEDIGLVNACLMAEREFLNRQWRALDRLSAYTRPGPGYMRMDLTKTQSLEAVHAVVALGWWSDAPDNPNEEDRT